MKNRMNKTMSISYMIKIDAHVQISVVTMHLAFPISEYSVFTYFAKK